MAWALQRRLTLCAGNAFFTPRRPPELPPIRQASPTDTCLPHSSSSLTPATAALLPKIAYMFPHIDGGEPLPMGDCEFAETKRTYGDRIALI